jgi:undecaprenyl-diphosphatase
MDRLEAYDLGMLYWFLAWRSPWLDEFAMAATHLGDFVVLFCVTSIATGFFLGMRRARLAGVFLLVVLLGWGIEWGLKLTVNRPRPHVAGALAEPPNNPSFPSGHALMTMAVYGTLGLLLGRIDRRRAVLFLALGVLLSLLVGLTRVVIGVHYPFDVLAGWLAGLLCVLVAAALAGPRDEPTGAAPPTPAPNTPQ